jgi:hypothetical protein
MASAFKLTAALGARLKRGRADADAAVTPDQKLTAALGTTRSLTALVASFDQPAADKITAALAADVRKAADALAGHVQARIDELTDDDSGA